MGRIRTIKPEFFKHSALYDAEIEFGLPLRLAFAGLWTCCDREGRFKWRSRELKLDVLPYDNCDFSRVLDALATRGFVVKYASGSELFGFIPSWKDHQFINNKEQESHIPEPQENQYVDASVTRESRDSDAASTRGVKEGKGREGKKEGKDASETLEIPEWLPLNLWENYLEMRKKSRKVATEEAKRQVILTLGKFRLKGIDIEAVLQKSIINNWTDVYEPKSNSLFAAPSGPRQIKSTQVPQ